MALPKHGQDLRDTRRVTRERHVERLQNGKPIPDPALTEGWDSLQLYWLAHIPGYREEVKKKVAEARLRQYKLDQKILARGEWARVDKDELGREVEGCG